MQLGEEAFMERVIIGVDPRKLPVTIEARDSREVLRAIGWFETSTAGYRELLRAALHLGDPTA